MESLGKIPIANMRASSLNSFMTIFLLEGRAFVGSKFSSNRSMGEIKEFSCAG